MSRELIVDLKGASRAYGATTVLRNVDLALAVGERLSIVGPSGSGKSTLLNLLGLLDAMDAGEYLFSGRKVSALPEKQKASLRATDIGFIFQLHHLLPQISLLENVLLPAYALPQKPDWAEVKARAGDLLGRVGLGDHLHKLPGQLSGGERQRAAVVRSLINKPRLVLADEPTGALDRNNALRLTDLLLEISAEGRVCLVVVTHDLMIAEKVGRVCSLNEGRLEMAL